MNWEQAVSEAARESGFGGVVSVGGTARAFGLADRAHEIAFTTDTRCGIASGSKAMTALAVMSLVADGTLTLDTTARGLLGEDLPLVDDAVTVEHLLGHRSGIGDYLDEDELDGPDDYVLTRPVHELDSTEAFLPLLDGLPQKFAPGTDFSYCNGGYVLLALLAERASGVGYHDLVRDRLLEPAGMSRSDFLRSDDLPGDVAIGYLTDGRTNVFHLPVLATGDGGLHTTVADLDAFWSAFLGGRIVPHEYVELMLEPHSHVPSEDARYGLGFWLDEEGPRISLVGEDAGVSFQSSHDPTTGLTWSVLCNDAEGAWPVAKAVVQALKKG